MKRKQKNTAGNEAATTHTVVVRVENVERERFYGAVNRAARACLDGIRVVFTGVGILLAGAAAGVLIVSLVSAVSIGFKAGIMGRQPADKTMVLEEVNKLGQAQGNELWYLQGRLDNHAIEMARIKDDIRTLKSSIVSTNDTTATDRGEFFIMPPRTIWITNNQVMTNITWQTHEDHNLYIK